VGPSPYEIRFQLLHDAFVGTQVRRSVRIVRSEVREVHLYTHRDSNAYLLQIHTTTEDYEIEIPFGPHDQIYADIVSDETELEVTWEINGGEYRRYVGRPRIKTAEAEP